MKLCSFFIFEIPGKIHIFVSLKYTQSIMKKKFSGSKVIWIIVGLAVAAGIVFGYNRLHQSRQRKEWIQSPFIHEGITSGGISLGGLRKEQAEQRMKQHEDAILSHLEICLIVDGKRHPVTAQQAGISIDAEKTAEVAYSIGREGNYRQLAEEMAQLTEGREIQPCYMLLPEKTAALAETLTEKYGTLPQDAQIRANGDRIEYIREIQGACITQEGLTKALNEAIETERWEIVLPLQTTDPAITVDAFTPGMVLRSSAITYFDGTADNRGQNIQKAVSMLHGTLLHSGESFSMNTVLGDRTSKNGWALAPAIVDGGARREDQPGGGVCQVSSTLYNAVAKADLKITGRKNHSVPVNYVKAGLDATINTGTIDFTWENNTDGDIYIHAEIQDDKGVYIQIFGLPFTGFEEIKLESQYIRAIKPEGDMKIEYDPTCPSGYEKVETEPSDGAIYTSYKLYYSDGKVIRKEKLHDSKYRAQTGIKVIGTKK